MEVSKIVAWATEHWMAVVVIVSLLLLIIFNFITRVVYNGPWQTPKRNMHTWTTMAGKGTTFVTKYRVLMPRELSSRQKKMKEKTFSPIKALLIIVVVGLLVLAIVR